MYTPRSHQLPHPLRHRPPWYPITQTPRFLHLSGCAPVKRKEPSDGYGSHSMIAPYPPGHSQPRVAAGIAAIEEAYHAVAQGLELVPSEGYYPKTLKWRSVEGRKRLIAQLDEEFLQELTKSRPHFAARGQTKHPQLYRMSDRTALWLCERLEEVDKIPWRCTNTSCEKAGTVYANARWMCEEHAHTLNIYMENVYYGDD